MSNSKK